jgi:hypothetical protein
MIKGKPLSNPYEKSNMYEGFERGFPFIFEFKLSDNGKILTGKIFCCADKVDEN